MIKEIELRILPESIEDFELIESKIFKKIKVSPERITAFEIVRRSIDARGAWPYFLLKIKAYIDEAPPEENAPIEYQVGQDAKRIIIVGAGPAGYFAALKCLELGMKPIVLDRGKKVQERRRDLKAIQQQGEVNPHSNYCFGEGGAGTYSDGKLYTRSHKRGKIKEVLEILVDHGASQDILIDAHPHIGSNKLPKIVENIRETIVHSGGEIHFDTYVDDFIIEGKSIKGAKAGDLSFEGVAVILATGHSARDIFYLCDEHDIATEFKPFALGVRVEHPQSLIDKIQYNQVHRQPNLPASSYSLVCQVENKGVFSFCMCPGGLVVPAATAPGELVVNGMSLSKRDSPYSNSGVVTSIEWDDLKDFHHHGKYAGLEFQKSVEQRMFEHGDGSQKAPAQRITDFVKNKISDNLRETSYIPGVYPAPMHELLPTFITKRLQAAFVVFGKKMKGYFTPEAQIMGTESRTSSPIRIPRNAEYQSDSMVGLFPCGEGAGYAGGILSAALDGQNVAKAIHTWLK